MLKKIIVKYKDGDVFLHKPTGREDDDLNIISDIIKNTAFEAGDEADEGLVVHSIEIIFA